MIEREERYTINNNIKETEIKLYKNADVLFLGNQHGGIAQRLWKALFRKGKKANLGLVEGVSEYEP